jgi:hypothetical protein
MNMIIAARPGYAAAALAYRSWTPIPLGIGGAALRAGESPYYRQRRRLRWVQRPQKYIWSTPPLPCAFCGRCDAPKGLHPTHCLECISYLEGTCPSCFPPPRRVRTPRRTALRARIARPLRTTAARMLRDSRKRPGVIIFPSRGLYLALRPRASTWHALTQRQARYLHKRRSLARQARARGWERIRAGLWYDRIGDVVYNQSAVDLSPIPHIVYKPEVWK